MPPLYARHAAHGQDPLPAKNIPLRWDMVGCSAAIVQSQGEDQQRASRGARVRTQVKCLARQSVWLLYRGCSCSSCSLSKTMRGVCAKADQQEARTGFGSRAASSLGAACERRAVGILHCSPGCARLRTPTRLRLNLPIDASAYRLPRRISPPIEAHSLARARACERPSGSRVDASSGVLSWRSNSHDRHLCVSLPRQAEVASQAGLPDMRHLSQFQVHVLSPGREGRYR